MSADAVAAKLGVDPAAGMSAAHAADLLAKNGPNALPEEKPQPGWLRFLDEYRTFMQIVLVGAGVVSLLIAEWSTAILLFVLTVVDAVTGLREQGKAESAMHALKSMMKTSARVRRDGAEAAVPADQIVAGDVVPGHRRRPGTRGRPHRAGQLPADRRVRAHRGKHPRRERRRALDKPDLGPGDQTNMAFMNNPVTHGSGVMIVTGTGADTQVGKISGLLKATGSEQTPLTRQLTLMTQWIALAALVTMIVMFALGLSRGESGRALFVTAIALAIAAIPEALPTVVQVILSLGAVGLAKRNAIVKNLSAVETLGSTSAINSDKTGTLTMNQMTAVDVLDPTDRDTITGMGYGLEGKVQHTVVRRPRSRTRSCRC